MVELLVKNPAHCSEEERELFRSILCTRPEISQDTIASRISKAGKLAFAYVDGVPAGIAAVKQARKGFRRRILEAQTTGSVGELPHSELGWLNVFPIYRGQGIGSSLVSSLCEELSGKAVFSLTEPDNKAMRGILMASGFSLCGKIHLEGRLPYLLYLRPSFNYDWHRPLS